MVHWYWNNYDAMVCWREYGYFVKVFPIGFLSKSFVNVMGNFWFPTLYLMNLLMAEKLHSK